nr:hypothetical protein [Catenibacterium mitsuokai]
MEFNKDDFIISENEDSSMYSYGVNPDDMVEGKLDENVLGYSIMAPVDLMIDEEEAAAEDLMHQSSMVRCVDIVEAVSGIDDMQD